MGQKEMNEPDLDSMSEVERILYVFDEAIRIETEAAGSAPCVAILGHQSFNSLLAALKIKCVDFGWFTPGTKHFGELEYKGVTIYCSHAIEDGLVMGHMPPKQDGDFNDKNTQ